MPVKRSRRGPEPIGSILSELIARRGFARLREQEHLEQVWREAAGKLTANYSRVGSVRQGVLEILVAHSILLQELSSFRKHELLDKVGQLLGTERIRDIRFRLDEGV